jgi:D-sedoheptulose 7-phosphate isomerase
MKPQTAAHLQSLFTRYQALTPNRDPIIAAFETIVACSRRGNKLLVCGNGGSAADAEHIVGELMNRYLLRRAIPSRDVQRLQELADRNAPPLVENLQQAVAAISLVSQAALTTAIANDLGAELVFAQQVYGYGREGDVLIAISTSGNAKNVLNALHVARMLGIASIGLTGESGGAIKGYCDIAICVPAKEAFRVQELHLPVYHTLCAMVESELFG